jgi:glutathione peroxidase-family protein
MGILDRTNQNQPIPSKLEVNQLTIQEIEILLSMIKKTTFLGEDIEPLYNLIIKLQNQYIEQTK